MVCHLQLTTPYSPILELKLTALVTQLVKNLPAMWEAWVRFLEKRERLPTPVLWPREFHGLYSPWTHEESDMTEWLSI